MGRFVKFRSGWAFFNSLGLFCLVWVGWDIIAAIWFPQHRFDPYPFELLTLILSIEASLSTALVMMELNRQSEGDRKLLKQALELNVQIVAHVKSLVGNVTEMAADLDRLVEMTEEMLQQAAV